MVCENASSVRGVGWGGVGEGGGGELLTCPYPLKIQACAPRNQRPSLRAGVSGQEDVSCRERDVAPW